MSQGPRNTEFPVPRVIAIPNMSCSGCVKGVMASINAAASGVRAEADLEARQVVVDGVSNMDHLLATLRADGWEASTKG